MNKISDEAGICFDELKCYQDMRRTDQEQIIQSAIDSATEKALNDFKSKYAAFLKGSDEVFKELEEGRKKDEEINKWKNLFRIYGTHEAKCPAQGPNSFGPCDCGFTKIVDGMIEETLGGQSLEQKGGK